MKRTAYLILAISFIITYASCSKLKEKKMSVTLNDYISHYPGLQAIEEEKSALDVQASEMEPTKNEDLEECAKVLGKLYTVYTTELPPLIEQEKKMRIEAIASWKKHYISEVADAENLTSQALNQLEVNALRDLLATKIKANEVAIERFNTFQLMAVQLQVQAESLEKRAQNVTIETEADLLAAQEAFNKFGTFILSEQQWLLSHPPTEKAKVIEEWRLDLPHSKIVEQALKSYQETYE
ncbi:MAG: hypothetical protein KFB93_04260 [Simkaniaceae bacterium]|nr:MAG: hypothetical protein KFB93_04260 [Simkaniaceae bacterium]